MSEENLEVVRRAIEAYGREGLDGVLGYYDPEIEWTSTGDYIERATYRGHDGLRRYLGTMEEEFKDLRIEPVQLIDAGEQVISSVRFTGRGKASDAPVEMTLISVGSLRDGLSTASATTPTCPPPSKPPGCGSRDVGGDVEIVEQVIAAYSGPSEAHDDLIDPAVGSRSRPSFRASGE